MIPCIDLNLSVCKIKEFTLKFLKEMLEVLGLGQAITTKPLKLAEMVPDFLQKSIIPPTT